MVIKIVIKKVCLSRRGVEAGGEAFPECVGVAERRNFVVAGRGGR